MNNARIVIPTSDVPQDSTRTWATLVDRRGRHDITSAGSPARMLWLVIHWLALFAACDPTSAVTPLLSGDPSIPSAESVDGIETPGWLAGARPGWHWQFVDLENQRHDESALWSWGQWLDRPAVPQVILTDQTLLTVADPLRRGPVFESGDVVRVRTRYWGDIHVPRARVAAVVLTWPAGSLERDRLLSRLQTPSDQTCLGTISRDELVGTITQVSPTQVTMQIDQRNVDIPMGNIMWMHFAQRTTATSDPPAATAYLALNDGSVLHARRVTLAEGVLTVTTVDSIELTSPSDLAIAAEIQHIQMTGPRVIRLDQLTPAKYRYRPWIDRNIGLGIHRNLRGERLRSADRAYRFGIAMHAPARAEYHLPTPARWFVSRLGLESSTGNQGSVRYRIWTQAPDQSDWQLQFESDVVRGSDTPPLCRVDLTGASDLALEVDVADHGFVLDRALWLDARMVVADTEGPPP